MQRLSAYYNNPDIGWRYLFIGTTNYKNLDWGMLNVTYKNICVVADE